MQPRLLIIVALLMLFTIGCNPVASSKPPVKPPRLVVPAEPPLAPDPAVASELIAERQGKAEARALPPRENVRGIYLTSYSAANPAKLGELLDLVDRTELNAMVVNVKDDWGNLTFESKLPLAQAAGAVSPDINLHDFTAKLKARHVYAIARIVTFKDAIVPKYRPDLAIASTSGGIWHDYSGVTWLNPYNRDGWDYLVDVAKEAADAGFNEVQFDYVRFPTDGNLETITYPGKDGRKRAQVIADFLAYARQTLRPYHVWVSADVFGLVTSSTDDMGIGQRLEEISDAVDYLSPMVYPSHYTKGNLGVANPNGQPYETVYRSMLDAKDRWDKAGQATKVTMRPWLQDFSLGFPYTPKEVRAQIQATYDAGYSQWLLWNAANSYSEAALKPKGQE